MDTYNPSPVLRTSLIAPRLAYNIMPKTASNAGSTMSAVELPNFIAETLVSASFIVIFLVSVQGSHLCASENCDELFGQLRGTVAVQPTANHVD